MRGQPTLNLQWAPACLLLPAAVAVAVAVRQAQLLLLQRDQGQQLLQQARKPLLGPVARQWQALLPLQVFPLLLANRRSATSAANNLEIATRAPPPLASLIAHIHQHEPAQPQRLAQLLRLSWMPRLLPRLQWHCQRLLPHDLTSRRREPRYRWRWRPLYLQTCGRWCKRL